MSDYFKHHATISSFNAESWVILSEIEQRIKEKIEKVGTPLKDWDINIYRGVLTGFNGDLKEGGCFIITGWKREEILANCKTEEERQKTDEIIRPILRGRDIKRYGYEWAELWLINTHNGVREKGIKRINIDDYPAVKAHLDLYYTQLEKRADQGDTPYNLRNCAYMGDFSKQKIVYSNMCSEPSFVLDNKNFLTNQKCFILTGKRLNFLITFFNSKLFEVILWNKFPSLGAKGRELSKVFMIEIPILKPSQEIEQKISILLEEKNYTEIDKIIYELYNLTDEEIAFIETKI